MSLVDQKFTPAEAIREMLINSLCGRIAALRGARNLNILLYMLRFLRSVRVSAKRQTLHSIHILPHSELISVSLAGRKPYHR